MIGTMIFVGMLVGASISGPLADRYGRRYTLMVSTACSAIFSLFSAFIGSFTPFLIFRTLVGVMVGFTSPIAVTFTTEISTSVMRGKA